VREDKERDGRFIYLRYCPCSSCSFLICTISRAFVEAKDAVEAISILTKTCTLVNYLRSVFKCIGRIFLLISVTGSLQEKVTLLVLHGRLGRSRIQLTAETSQRLWIRVFDI
jgi:hypothetical protein